MQLEDAPDFGRGERDVDIINTVEIDIRRRDVGRAGTTHHEETDARTTSRQRYQVRISAKASAPMRK